MHVALCYAMTDTVIVAKEALMVALGGNWKRYLTNMKLWFHNKWTKEEFDIECRKLLTLEEVHLHNQFLIAVLVKLDAFKTKHLNPVFLERASSVSIQIAPSGRSSSRKRRRSYRSFFDRVSFEPCDFLEFLPEDNAQLIRPPWISEGSQNQNVPIQRYSVQELFLPDAGFIMCRCLIGAWEAGLVSVDDNVGEYIVLAVQVFLKNFLYLLITKRKHYKTTSFGNFYYDVGVSSHNSTLRNSVTRLKVDDSPLELDKEITSTHFMRRTNDDNVLLCAYEEVEHSEYIITLKDCQHVFRDRNLISSHLLHSINVERINMMLR